MHWQVIHFISQDTYIGVDKWYVSNKGNIPFAKSYYVVTIDLYYQPAAVSREGLFGLQCDIKDTQSIGATSNQWAKNITVPMEGCESDYLRNIIPCLLEIPSCLLMSTPNMRYENNVIEYLVAATATITCTWWRGLRYNLWCWRHACR